MIQKADNKIPEISPEDMARIDDIAINKIGLSLLQMIENAGKTLAKIAINNYRPKRVTILCGKGNNGGGGLVCARYLKNFGINVSVIAAESITRKIPLHQLKIAKNMGVPLTLWKNSLEEKQWIIESDLIIDALLGYNAKGKPKHSYDEIIQAVKGTEGKVLSLDVPTGLDLDSGKWYTPSLKNTDVATLALPFKHLVNNERIDKVYLVDLGIPKVVFEKIGITTPQALFHSQEYILLKEDFIQK